MPEEAVLLLMLNLSVGNGGLADRTPVDDAGAFVDVAFLVQLYKYLKHCIGAALVHGKTFSVPVSGGAQLVQLLDDAGAVLLLPVPACFQEFVTAQIMLVHALFSQLVNDLNLRCDGCMVRTRLPQSLVALHSLITGQDILHGIVQCMAHMQLTGNVWRRHNNGERLLALSPSTLSVCMEILVVQPFLIQLFLNGRRIVILFQFFHDHFLSLCLNV